MATEMDRFVSRALDLHGARWQRMFADFQRMIDNSAASPESGMSSIDGLWAEYVESLRWVLGALRAANPEVALKHFTAACVTHAQQVAVIDALPNTAFAYWSKP